MSQRLAEIAARADAILETGCRREVLDLLALLAGRAAVAQERVREIREQAAAPARDLTVRAASAVYPVSRSFLYERGEALGLVHKTPEGKVTVIESALRAYLEGHHA